MKSKQSCARYITNRSSHRVVKVRARRKPDHLSFGQDWREKKGKQWSRKWIIILLHCSLVMKNVSLPNIRSTVSLISS